MKHSFIISKRASILYSAIRPDGSPSPDDTTELDWSPSDVCKEHQVVLGTLPKNPIRLLLELLVAISNSLGQDDYELLGPILWSNFLELDDSKTVAAVSSLERLVFLRLNQKRYRRLFL